MNISLLSSVFNTHSVFRAQNNGRQTNLPAKKQMHSPNSAVKTSVYYTTDIHCQIPKMERLVSGALQAKINAKKEGAGFIKVCSGDTFIGADEKRNKTAAKFYDVIGMDAAIFGNHEFDGKASTSLKLIQNNPMAVLGMNMNFPENDKTGLSKRIKRSYIYTDDKGVKHGFIGLQPSDMNARIKNKSLLEGITIDDKEQTIKELKEEVKKLQEQGINIIHLLSHEGDNVDKEIAERVSGIDVIYSGHSHKLVEDVKEGKNLFYSPAGEPVVLVQAGRDGNNFGVLNLEFDKKGRITYVQNNITETDKFPKNLVMEKIADSILGKSPAAGELRYADPLPKNALTEENPWADFTADALKTMLDADIALVNSANFRGSITAGKITERDISSIFPFAGRMHKVRINEKDLVNAIKACGKSLSAKNSKPGLMQVSGLTYALDKSGNLKSMTFIDKQGGKHNINPDAPCESKIYTAVYDDFLVNGGDNLSMLKRSESDIIQKYNFDKDKITIDYIKSLPQPFEVRKDGRIQIL